MSLHNLLPDPSLPTSSHPLPTMAHQVGGEHYLNMEVQPWDAMLAWLGKDGFAAYLRGCVVKYVARCHSKGDPVENLKKARHCLDRLIELHEP